MVVDMSIEKLYAYQGVNPCPEDFDEFWDAMLDEMYALDNNVELIPTKRKYKNVDTFDLYFTGMDGAKIHAKYLRPECGKNLPVIYCFHGYSGSSGDFPSWFSYILQGYAVAALDCRGQGGLSEDKGGTVGNTLNGHIIRGIDGDSPRDLLFVKNFLDTAQLVKIVEQFSEIDSKRQYAFGGSQGGGLTYACCALCPQIKKAVAKFPFLSDYKRVWEMDLAKDAYDELSLYFRRFDPRHERHDEVFYRLGYIDIQNLAKRIKAKMLMLTGLMDTICPPSTQFAAFNKVTSEKKVVFYDDFGHEPLPGEVDLIFEWFAD